MNTDDAKEVVLRKIVVNYATGCWEAIYRNKSGYGQIKYKGKPTRLHILSYKSFVGDIPKGFHVHHICENVACANFNHLEALSPKEHKARHKKPIRTECPFGHALTAENIFNYSSGVIRCKTCHHSMLKGESFYKKARREKYIFTEEDIELQNLVKNLDIAYPSEGTLKLQQKFASMLEVGINGCWNSKFPTYGSHYPVIDFKGLEGKWLRRNAHIVSYLLFVKYDLDRDNKHLHHKCGNKLCCNFNHLELLTPKEHGSQRTYNTCKNGHLMTEDNTYTWSTTGHRRCKICNNETQRRRLENKENRDKVNNRRNELYAKKKYLNG